jgi:hypothetical protein
MQAEKYISGRRSGAFTEHDLHAEQRGEDADGDYEAILDLLEEILEKWNASDRIKIKSDQAKDATEGKLAVMIFAGLRSLPGRVLSDRDFWRYCAAYLYDLVEWRNGNGCSLINYGASANAIGHDCMPHRMFERASIAHLGGVAAGDTDPFELAKFGASDVWRSHILRVLNGNAPVLVHEILTDVKEGNLKTEIVRPLIRDLRRVRANIVFELLDQSQARVLLDRERKRTLETLD